MKKAITVLVALVVLAMLSFSCTAKKKCPAYSKVNTEVSKQI